MRDGGQQTGERMWGRLTGAAKQGMAAGMRGSSKITLIWPMRLVSCLFPGLIRCPASILGGGLATIWMAGTLAAAIPSASAQEARGIRSTIVGRTVSSRSDAAEAGRSVERINQRKGHSGLPLPRFVSLKSNRVNMRAGPGLQYPTKWVYRRAGLPVEVVREYDGWREVRDAEGVSGWVIGSLLSGRRTALVEPWDVKKSGAKPAAVALKDDDRPDAGDVARIEIGVIANVRSCDGRWCAVSVGAFRGYLAQKSLWGVYPNEAFR